MSTRDILKSIAIVVLILAALNFLGKYENNIKSSLGEGTKKSGPNDNFSVSNIMSGTDRKIISQNFETGDIFCLMGGSKIDFSNAVPSENARLDVTAIMGGADIIVPKDWTVVSNMTALMGGTEIEKSSVNDPKKVLTLDGFLLMGGLTVKRK